MGLPAFQRLLDPDGRRVGSQFAHHGHLVRLRPISSPHSLSNDGRLTCWGRRWFIGRSVVLVTSFLGCAIPLLALPYLSLKWPRRILFVVRHAGTGVFLSTACILLFQAF